MVKLKRKSNINKSIACLLIAITFCSSVILSCMTSSKFVTAQSNPAIDPWDYQKMLGKGMDVDWCKTTKGRETYNVQVVKDFKAAGISHVRIRIKDKATEDLLEELDKQINDCLENGLIPVIAYQADEFKNEPTEENITKVIEWWSTVANRYKDVSHLLSFDLLIEATDALNKEPEKLNEIYERLVTEIRKTNETRIIMISPRLRSDAAYLSELKIPTKHNGYLMAEWHFYASGPSKTNDRKLWTTGTAEEKKKITDKIQLALEFQEKNHVPTWVGAWMVGNYNDGNDYTVEEQVVFATYMTEQLSKAGIPFAINSDTKFYDREKNTWIGSMKPVFNTVFGTSEDESTSQDNANYAKGIQVGFNAKGSLSVKEQCSYISKQLGTWKKDKIDTSKIWIRLQGGTISQKTYPKDWSADEYRQWADIQKKYKVKLIFVVNLNDTASSQLGLYKKFVKAGLKFSAIELGNEQYLARYKGSLTEKYDEVTKRTANMTPAKYIKLCNEYIKVMKNYKLPFYVQFAPENSTNKDYAAWNKEIAKGINKNQFLSTDIHGTIHLYERNGSGTLNEKQITSIRKLVNKPIHMAITESGVVDKKGELTEQQYIKQEVALTKRILSEMKKGDIILNQVLYTDYKTIGSAVLHDKSKGLTSKGKAIYKLFKQFW